MDIIKDMEYYQSYEYQGWYTRAWAKKNRAKIREKLQQKVICGCGSVVTLSSLYNHNNTRKHNNYINENRHVGYKC